MLWLSLILVCLFSTARGAQAKKPDLPPTTLQLDIVYPRPNEIHRRTYPFPVIFAIHGAKNLWPYHLNINWSLFDRNSTDSHEAIDGGTFNDSDPFSSPRWTEGDYPDGDDDPFYYISWSRAIGRLDSTDYGIGWFINLAANCTKGDTSPGDIDNYPPGYEQPWAPRIDGWTDFRVSDDAPLELESDSCMAVNRTFINGWRNTLRVGGTVTEEQCIFFDEDDFRPEPKPCAAKVDAALTSKVTETMLAAAWCTGVDWPDEVDGQCTPDKDDDEDGAGRLGGGHILAVFLSAGLGALFVMG